MPLAVVVVVENGGSGSKVAIPVANKVMQARSVSLSAEKHRDGKAAQMYPVISPNSAAGTVRLRFNTHGTEIHRDRVKCRFRRTHNDRRRAAGKESGP